MQFSFPWIRIVHVFMLQCSLPLLYGLNSHKHGYFVRIFHGRPKSSSGEPSKYLKAWKCTPLLLNWKRATGKYRAWPHFNANTTTPQHHDPLPSFFRPLLGPGNDMSMNTEPNVAMDYPHVSNVVDIVVDSTFPTSPIDLYHLMFDS